MSLENAPDEVKLAVDLIMLLENHEIPAETVLKALEIVRRDFEGKLPPHPSPLPEGEGENRSLAPKGRGKID
ncbi:TPA: pleiotropic regulatory protein RsmS [Enterobacter cloacae]|nr:pleiotropic regulatory protein RsmS [Enterobacter cloacae]